MSTKACGDIVDDKDRFRNLEASVTDYSAGAFGGYHPDDTAGLPEDRLAKGRGRLKQALENRSCSPWIVG